MGSYEEFQGFDFTRGNNGHRTQIIELVFPKAGMETMKMAKKLDGQEENKQLPGACPLKN